MISKRNSQNEATIGMIWGRMPHRIPDTQRPPVASTASSGPVSTPSMASVAHLPRVPTECRPIARVPAHGPRPVIGMKITATMSSGTARMALNNWRTGILIQRGATLVAARNASGSERIAPMIVPIQAM